MSEVIELPVVFKNEGMQIVGMLHKPNISRFKVQGSKFSDKSGFKGFPIKS